MYGVEGRENKKAEKNEKQRSEEKKSELFGKNTEIVAAYIGCHAKITQLLLNNRSPQRLSSTFINLNFLTNVLNII